MTSDRDFPAFVCPEHGQDLVPDGDALICQCGERFDIVGEIPRFVNGARYADAFGTQWNHFRRTQLDSHSGTTISIDRCRRVVGEDLWARMPDQHVAELGCGAGRFTELLLDRGAMVTSIDLSSAVEANRDNFPVSARHRIAQADILHLPFAPQQFDVVFCLGVIQHTPSPEQTIAALYDQVRPGGSLVFDHNSVSFSWYTRPAPLARRVLRRFEPLNGMRATERLVNAFLPLHKRSASNRLARVAMKRVSPILSFYEVFPELDDDQQREWALLDTHDSLTAWYRHNRSPQQVRAYLKKLGLEEIWCEPGGVGVEARGRRPSRSS